MVRTFQGDKWQLSLRPKALGYLPPEGSRTSPHWIFFSDKLGQDQKKSHLCSARWGAVKVPFEMTRTFAQWWPSAPVPSQSQKNESAQGQSRTCFWLQTTSKKDHTDTGSTKISPGYSDIHLPNQLARGYGFETRKVMDFGFLSPGSLGRNGKAISLHLPNNWADSLQIYDSHLSGMLLNPNGHNHRLKIMYLSYIISISN